MVKTKFFLIFILTVSFAAASCQMVEKIIDSKKKARKGIVSKVYARDGLSFSYPDNWQITEDKISEKGLRHVSIEDADNSVIVISLIPTGLTLDLNEYAENFKNDLPGNTPLGEISQTKLSPATRLMKGQLYSGFQLNYIISLVGQSVPHTTYFFLNEGQRSKTLLTIQAPDEDLLAAEKEFQVILDSLKAE